MPSSVQDLTDGWTGQLVYILALDDVPQDLTGLTVTAILKSADQVVIDTVGDVAVTGLLTGEVTFSPDPADLPAGNYSLRFKVVDGSSRVVYFPNGEPIRLRVFAT